MLETKEWEVLNDITASLHGIENSTAMRQTFLSKLSLLIEFDLGDFNLGQTLSKGVPILMDPVVFSSFPKSFEEKFTQLYEDVYSHIDYVSWLFSHHQSIAYRESDLINSTIRKETEFYKEYLAKFDLGLVAGVSIISSGCFVGAITLYKSEELNDFSEKDLYILKQLLPHLQIKLASTEEAALKNKKHLNSLLTYNYHLTKKEITIIGQIKEGLSNQEIADLNFISINTTKNHISHIYEKFSVKSRTQLLQFLSTEHLVEYWD